MISRKMEGIVNNSSLIRAMFEEGNKLAAKYGEENVFDFSIGNPNVDPPQEVKNAIVDILNEESAIYVHGYMNNSGYEDVREAIANYINKNNNTSYTYENIIMTVGAAGGLNVILKCILNPEDEVVVFAPFFGEYRSYVSNYDGKLVIVNSDTKTFQPDIKAFEEAINEKTKAVIINTPHNPTGVIYNEDTIIKLADVLNKKQKQYNTNIYLSSDEPYREVVYGDIKIPHIPNYYNNTFIGYSYSKSLSLPGERIGYIVVGNEMEDKSIMFSALNSATRILGFVNAPSLFQRVIGRTLDAKVDVSKYKQNRDILYNHLISLGFECIKPEGAFYLFPKALIEDDVKFAEAAKKYNLLIVPGSAFGCPGYFRLAYCISTEKIKNSLPAFTKLAEEFKK